MKQMKILYIIGQLSRGGAEQQLYYLLSQLPEPATVLSLSKGGYWVEPIRELGHEVIELERTKRFEFKRFFSTLNLMKKSKPDIIHIFLDGISSLYARLAGIITNNPLVVIGERSIPLHYPKWYRFLLPYLNRFVARIVCNSLTACEFYKINKLAKDSLRLWVKKAELRPELFQWKKANLYYRLNCLLEQDYRDKDCRRLRKQLQRYREELFIFLEYEGVSPYNNHAEQQMRKPVLWRRRCQQNRSDKGAEAQAILMTVFRTAELQGLNPVDYVEALIKEQILQNHGKIKITKKAA